MVLLNYNLIESSNEKNNFLQFNYKILFSYALCFIKNNKKH